MVISVPKKRYVRCQVSDVVVLIDPPAGLKGTVVIRTETPVPVPADGSPDTIYGAGEYEVSGIVVRGVQLAESDTEHVRTGYTVQMDDITLGFFEAAREGELKEKSLETTAEIDILFISVGGDHLETKKAVTFIKQFDPRCVIVVAESEKEARGLAEEMGKKVEVVDKMVVKKRDLDAQDGMKVIWMNEK